MDYNLLNLFINITLAFYFGFGEKKLHLFFSGVLFCLAILRFALFKGWLVYG